MNLRPIILKMVGPAYALAPNHNRPRPVRTVTLEKLCKEAQIPCRVTLGAPPKIFLHGGAEHYRAPGIYYVGMGTLVRAKGRVSALRALEVLAYSFHDYGARECARGMFVAPKKRK